jgi:hypothetical protein
VATAASARAAAALAIDALVIHNCQHVPDELATISNDFQSNVTRFLCA